MNRGVNYIKSGLAIVGFVWLAMIILSSCNPDKIRQTEDTFLKFSRDTVSFDTVFTSLGSATRSFKIYNQYDEIVNISKIELADKAKGFYRLNIDGKPLNKDENVEIFPNDSIYVFVEVTIDPDQPLSSSPFFVEDEIRIETNGNEQKVHLLAWGQNANYIPNSKNKGGQALLSCNFGEVRWDDEKPYVIYGVLLIDSCELVLPAGADIYVHGGVAFTDEGAAYNDGIILVLKDGKLTTEGTVDEPVSIQGDRLEEEFQDIPGQWGGIIIGGESKGTEFRYTKVKNSIVGVRVDSLAEASLYNCEFENQSANALLGFHSGKVYAENCLFAESGSAAVSLQYGGRYEFNYCTMANYNGANSAMAASNFRCTEPTCLGLKLYNEIQIDLRNTIINGSNENDQIQFVDGTEETGDFDYDFQHCIVQVEELLENPSFTNFFDFCSPCENVTMQDTVFLDPFAKDFMLDTSSVARDFGVPINGIDIDILNRTRDLSSPDAGCYELQ